MRIAVDYDDTIYFGGDVLKKALKILNKLEEKGHEIIIFTGRTEPVSDKLLKFTIVQNVSSTYGREWKVKSYRDYKFDMIIDDDPSVLKITDIPIKIMINNSKDWDGLEKLFFGDDKNE